VAELIFIGLFELFSQDHTIAIIAATIFSLLFTAMYWIMAKLVGFLHKHSGESRDEKIKYILTFALIFNLMPVFGVLELWFLLPVYGWPETFIEKVLNFDGPMLATTIPFWTIIGGLIGYIFFQIISRLRATRDIVTRDQR
jgi:putative flippase GtrA